jgi:hypothetical protein
MPIRLGDYKELLRLFYTLLTFDPALPPVQKSNLKTIYEILVNPPQKHINFLLLAYLVQSCYVEGVKTPINAKQQIYTKHQNLMREIDVVLTRLLPQETNQQSPLYAIYNTNPFAFNYQRTLLLKQYLSAEVNHPFPPCQVMSDPDVTITTYKQTFLDKTSVPLPHINKAAFYAYGKVVKVLSHNDKTFARESLVSMLIKSIETRTAEIQFKKDNNLGNPYYRHTFFCIPWGTDARVEIAAVKKLLGLLTTSLPLQFTPQEVKALRSDGLAMIIGLYQDLHALPKNLHELESEHTATRNLNNAHAFRLGDLGR